MNLIKAEKVMNNYTTHFIGSLLLVCTVVRSKVTMSIVVALACSINYLLER